MPSRRPGICRPGCVRIACTKLYSRFVHSEPFLIKLMLVVIKPSRSTLLEFAIWSVAYLAMLHSLNSTCDSCAMQNEVYMRSWSASKVACMIAKVYGAV
eukprot:4611725-Pleurochrysis_carterae.AAC.3